MDIPIQYNLLAPPRPYLPNGIDPAALRAQTQASRLIVVSNAEPYLHRKQDGRIICENVAGGVSTALDPLLDSNDLWIAWGRGEADFDVVDAMGKVDIVSSAHNHYRLKRLRLSPDEIERFYYGFSNSALWPVSHCFLQKAHFQELDWQNYCAVNRKFADAVLEEIRAGDLIWVQDYQLSLVPQFVRQAYPAAQIAFSWHIPFPAPPCFCAIPWGPQLLAGLLCTDHLGLYVPRYVKNFLSVAERLGYDVDHERQMVYHEGRSVKISPVPLGINYDWFTRTAAAAESRAYTQELRQRFPGETILLGVDRLDYTKGLLEKILGFGRFLRANPEALGKVRLIQIVAPSRTALDEYSTLQEQLSQAVALINQEFGRDGWEPISYYYQFVPQKDVIAYYQLADVLLVTSLADGMNLVAKEFVAVRNDGVLVLSQCAGAAEDMREAVLINPHNIDDIAHGIQCALTMAPEERRRRFATLKAIVRNQDVFWWKVHSLEHMLHTHYQPLNCFAR